MDRKKMDTTQCLRFWVLLLDFYFTDIVLEKILDILVSWQLEISATFEILAGGGQADFRYKYFKRVYWLNPD